MQKRLLTALATTGLILAGCTTPPPPPPVAPPPPPGTGESAYDLAGESPSCGKPIIITISPAAPLSFALQLTNDGGWCALRIQRPDGGGSKFDAGLLPTLPLHGTVFIHTVSHFTRIDYTPMAGYVGTDHFLVKLLPGYVPLRVDVTVLSRFPASTVTPAVTPPVTPTVGATPSTKP